ncbi:MAG: RNA methyltransferase, partial [Phycisphaeraceae bacterium]|nr:RNA methyltransferase [Phycisphaeraceae bacterium]
GAVPEFERLTSLENQRIKRVVRLRRGRHRREEGVCVVEGERQVQRALACGLAFEELFVCPELYDEPRPAVEPAVACFEVASELMEKMAYRENPEGILAVVKPPQWDLESMADRQLVLVSVSPGKPGNLGAMARTAEAAGVDAVLVADPVVDPFNPNAIRASTGAVFHLPVIAVEAGRLQTWLADAGYHVVAADPEGEIDYTDADLGGRVAVVIGPEAEGLDESWRVAADEVVSVPMHSQVVDSLNASVTAGVVLYEAIRQRRRTD